MAFRRLVDGFKWVKDKASEFNRKLSAAVKVSTMAGSAVFNANRFFAWALRVPQGLDTTPGLITAVVLSTGVAVDTFVCRALNMYSPRRDGITNGSDDPRSIARHATFFYPGTESSCTQRAAYIMLQMQCFLFMINSGVGSFQNQFSIEFLFAKIPTLELDSTCAETHSPYANIMIAHVVALYAAYSAIQSYRSSNLIRLRQYYVRYILQGEWRDFGFRSYCEAIITTSLYTRNIAFNTIHNWELMEKNSLCHIHAVPVPTGLPLGHTIEACFVNVGTNLGSGLAATHKRNTNRTVVELSALLENTPQWKAWDKFLRLCFYITALNAATGTFNALVEGTYEYWVIGLALIAALFTSRNQLSLSYEAYIQQLEARSVNPNALQTPLLSDGDDSEEFLEAEVLGREDAGYVAPLPTGEKVNEVPLTRDDLVGDTAIMVNPEIRYVPRQEVGVESISVAPSATMFGVSNPVNVAERIASTAMDQVYVDIADRPGNYVL